MSKMTACKACTKEVSKSAKVCPHCGQKLKMGFFKKALLGIVGFIVLIIIISNMGSKDKPTTGTTEVATAKANTATTASSAAPTAKPSPTPVELQKEGVSSDVKIAVTGFESKQKLGTNQFAIAEAQGVFKVVSITLTNNQKDAITVDSNSFELIDDQGRKFSASSEAQMALTVDDKNSFFLKQVNPGLSAKGQVAFDVPADAKGFKLDARGGMMGKKISLKVE
jgi:hypothetical protein